jgi:hypothetical protein
VTRDDGKLHCTDVLAESGLVDYSFVNADILERKSELGIAVHKACCLNDWGKRFTCDPEAEPYVDAWREFRERTKFVPRVIEVGSDATVNGMLYAMRVDREGILAGEETIVEIKTCANAMKHHGVQLAGYAMGLHHAKVSSPYARFAIRRRIVVKLTRQGIAKVIRYDDKSDADVFVSALYVVTWKRRHVKEYRKGEL